MEKCINCPTREMCYEDKNLQKECEEEIRKKNTYHCVNLEDIDDIDDLILKQEERK